MLLKLCRIVDQFFVFLEKARCLAAKSRIMHGTDFALRLPQLILHPENIHIGDNVYINKGLTALAFEEIAIGDYVMLGPNVSLLTSGHDPNLSGLKIQQSAIFSPINIRQGSWIGANTIILPGVEVGKNCVIGAGSVITKNIPDNSVAVGNPCKVIRKK